VEAIIHHFTSLMLRAKHLYRMSSSGKPRARFHSDQIAEVEDVEEDEATRTRRLTIRTGQETARQDLRIVPITRILEVSHVL
jgi:hypothetical protein